MILIDSALVTHIDHPDDVVPGHVRAPILEEGGGLKSKLPESRVLGGKAKFTTKRLTAGRSSIRIRRRGWERPAEVKIRRMERESKKRLYPEPY